MAQNSSGKKLRPRDSQTQQEIDRQHTLLAADLDKKALKGNAIVEDFRHSKEFTGLTKKEKRERFQIRLQRDEILDDLKKVKRGYSGYYDDSKSPIENIQSALRSQCQTPIRSSRLDVPNVYPVRKTKSCESLAVVGRGSGAILKGNVAVLRPKSVYSVTKGCPQLSKSTRRQSKPT